MNFTHVRFFQMKEDELEELRELNRHLQALLKEKDGDSNVLRHNVNVNIDYLLLTTWIKNFHMILILNLSLRL